jgi:hypothetical protein
LKNGWDIPILLQPDELLSSWLVRVALANGCDPLVISWAIWNKWRAWTNDLDRYPGEDRLVALSNYSGKDLNVLHEATLFPITSAILGREPSVNELWPWLLTTGTRNRIRKGGIQYCVDCLKEDKNPYFRREWRFAWHVSCTKHGKYLVDCCPHCQAPIEPHRLIAEDRYITICASCHLSLIDLDGSENADADVLSFQIWADDVINHREMPLAHNIPVNVQSWFEISRYYASYVRRCVVNPHPALQSFSEAVNFTAHQDILKDALKIDFEQMEIKARTALLISIFKLMRLPKDELIRLLRESVISKQGFTNVKHNFPNALNSIAESLPDKSRAKRTSSSKIHSPAKKLPSPKPLWEVNRMWRQLLQKMEENPDYGNSIQNQADM